MIVCLSALQAVTLAVFFCDCDVIVFGQYVRVVCASILSAVFALFVLAVALIGLIRLGCLCLFAVHVFVVIVLCLSCVCCVFEVSLVFVCLLRIFPAFVRLSCLLV